MQVSIFREKELTEQSCLKFSQINGNKRNQLKSYLSQHADGKTSTKISITETDADLLIAFNINYFKETRIIIQDTLVEMGIGDNKISCTDLWKLYPVAPESIELDIENKVIKQLSVSLIGKVVTDTSKIELLKEYEANSRGFTLIKSTK